MGLNPILYAGNVLVADMHSAFPFQKQPQISVPDYLTSLDPITRRSPGDLYYDRRIGCAHPAQVFVPHNQKITAGGVTVVDNNNHLLSSAPDVSWSTFSVSGSTAHIQMFRTRDAYGYQIIDLRSNNIPNAGSLQLSASVANSQTWQGFTFLFSRSMFTWHTSSGDPYVNLYFKVNSSPVAEYGVQITPQTKIQVVYSKDGGSTFVPVEAEADDGISIVPVMGNQARLRGDEMVAITVKAMAGRIMVAISGTDAVFTFPAAVPKDDDNDPDPHALLSNPLITQVRLSAKAFTHLSFALHPMKFRKSAAMRSNPLQLGFAPDITTPPYYLIYTGDEAVMRDSGAVWSPSFPAGSSATVTTVAGTETTIAPSYDLDVDNGTAEGTWQGVQYTAKTIAISRVTLRVDGIVERGTEPYITLPLAPNTPKAPFHVREEWTFDPGALTINHAVILRFYMREGVDSLLQSTGIGALGNIAIGLDLGYVHLTTPTVRFRGFCDTYEVEELPGNVRIITLYCVDQMQQMRDAFFFAPPNFDDWNHYAAVAECLMKCGISKDQMGFADKIPTDPFTSTPTDDTPYFLPSNIGFRTWTPINRNLPVRDIVGAIQKLTGFLLYVDAAGYFQYAPFIFNTEPVPKKIFRPYGTVASDSGFPNLDEMFGMNFHASTRPVRNRVALIGLDPYRARESTILRTRKDEASISSPVGSQPKNYVGYPKDMVWMESRFANAPFAEKSLKRIYNIVRQPEYTVNVSGWLQPDLFPLDRIAVDDEGVMNTSETPFFVFSIVNELMMREGPEGVLQSCTLSGRYIDPSALIGDS